MVYKNSKTRIYEIKKNHFNLVFLKFQAEEIYIFFRYIRKEIMPLPLSIFYSTLRSNNFRKQEFP